jgi:hypothetical protein
MAEFEYFLDLQPLGAQANAKIVHPPPLILAEGQH